MTRNLKTILFTFLALVVIAVVPTQAKAQTQVPENVVCTIDSNGNLIGCSYPVVNGTCYTIMMPCVQVTGSGGAIGVLLYQLFQLYNFSQIFEF